MVRPTARKRMYRTMQGRTIDIDKLRAQNESVQAVGNMNVNARGDILGPGGKVVKPKEQVMKDYYQTPRGAAQDTPVKKTQYKKQEPIPQIKVEQVQTMNPTVVEKKTVAKTPIKKTSTSTKKGIDAALDGLE